MEKDSLLNEPDKKKILRLIGSKDFDKIIGMLEKISSDHAGTAKTKDKRFVIREIVREIIDKEGNRESEFYKTGMYFCKRKEDNAKEIGVSLIWRGYDHAPEKVKEMLHRISDDPNWEVREYAGNAFAETLYYHKDFLTDLKEWSKHPSENVRRAVVFSALGVRDEKKYKTGFKILRSLMNDSSVYVKKNLGPFILGSLYGSRFPEETAAFLKKESRSKDPYVRWNIIMSFNNSFGKRNPDKALEVMKVFTDDENIIVIRAMRSTLKFLKKHYPEKADKFIKENYELKFK
ncbi:MAG TPA: HEAT repeat domain-containing protein [Ignavibacteria bacterium]|nr:HEAT repeat domain-containing protein [Ignavibacteria bacterium]HQY53097.1 HEAT repeat domain-containing protein [Ignavibacteria bacterium]HRB00679.1 HEAT repeat domain-containing protein [Ignavibacteria bacterium]